MDMLSRPGAKGEVALFQQPCNSGHRKMACLPFAIVPAGTAGTAVTGAGTLGTMGTATGAGGGGAGAVEVSAFMPSATLWMTTALMAPSPISTAPACSNKAAMYQILAKVCVLYP